MTWMFAALGGYALNAVASVFDKFLLSEKRIGAPALYAFFMSLTNLPFIALIPFGFVLFDPVAIAFGIGSGMLMLFGLLVSYQAIKRSEVTRAVPLIGVVSVVYLFLFSLVSTLLFGEGMTATDILALGLLVGGAVLLVSGGTGITGPGFVRSVLIAGGLFAIDLLFLKQSYLVSNFATGFVWSKVGTFLGGMSLLVVPSFRQIILSGHDRFSTPKKKRNRMTIGYFFLTQIFGGIGTILISYAISLGSATLVQGMSGVQYGLVFLFATILSIRYPYVFREHISRREMAQKAFAIGLLALGIWLVSMGAGLNRFL